MIHGQIPLTSLNPRKVPRRRNLVRPHLLRLWRQEQVIRLVLWFHSRRHSLEDLGGDGRLVIRVMVLRDEFLNLGRGEDPADVKEDFDIGDGCLNVSELPDSRSSETSS